MYINDKDSFIKEKLETVLATSTRIASPLSILLAILFLITIENLSALSGGQWLSAAILILALSMRTWWGFQSSKKWHFTFTLINIFVSLGWAGTLILAFTASDNSVAISNLTYAVTAGLVASTPHSLALSKRDFIIFLSCIISPLFFEFYQTQKGHFYLFSGFSIVTLFAIFLIKQRSQQEKVWKELQLFNYDLQKLIDTLPVGVAVIKNKILVKQNSYFTDILNKSKADENFKKIFEKFCHLSSRPVNEKFNSEFELPTHLGKKDIYLSIAINVDGFDGVETIVIVMNINEVRSLEVENQIQKMQIENNSKMAALGVMSSGLAHEINNPLATISGRVQLIHMILKQVEHQLDSEQTEKMSKSIEIIQKTIIRISKIIKGLRSFARETEGDPFETVNFKDVLETTLSFCETRLLSRGIEIETHISGDLKFSGRSTEISQVLLNALNNSCDAIESSPSSRWIKLNATEESQKIIIKIQDSGAGIDPKFRDKIMVPFFTTKEVGKGTGLGLSLSRGIVESHGGRMYFNFASPYTELVIELPSIKNNKNLPQKTAS